MTSGQDVLSPGYNSKLSPSGSCRRLLRPMALVTVSLRQKAALAFLGLCEYRRVFRRFAKRRQYRIELQAVVPTESTFDRGFHQTRRERVSQARVEQLCLAELGFRVAVGEDLLFELLQELLGSRRPGRFITSL